MRFLAIFPLTLAPLKPGFCFGAFSAPWVGTAKSIWVAESKNCGNILSRGCTSNEVLIDGPRGQCEKVYPLPCWAGNRPTSRLKETKSPTFKAIAVKLMNNTPITSTQALDVLPEPHQSDDTVYSLFVDQALASGPRSKFTIVDDGQGSVNLYVDLSSSQPTLDQSQPVGVKPSIPIFYLDLPPISKLALPATVPSEPGLVRLLATYPGNLPSTAKVPAELANRLVNEVVDHLDCTRLLEVRLVDVTEEWLGSFRDYLDIFYELERVTCYVETIRFLVARYNDEA